VSAVDFANAEDGYLYGPGLEVTRNDGGSWSKVALGQVAELTTAGGHGYALTKSTNPQGAEAAALWQARLGSTAWSRVVLPPATGTYQLVSGDHEVLLLQQSDDVAASNLGPPGHIWLRKTGGDGWREVAVPCQPEHDGAAASLAISPNSPTSWALDCELDSQSSQAMDVQHRIFVTANAGRTWTSAGIAPRQGVDAALAWNGSGDFLLATESAADQLDVSVDGGRRWRTAIGDGGDFYGWGNLSFVNTNTAFVVGPTHYGYGDHPDKLYRTVDGGERWSVVEMPEIAHLRGPPGLSHEVGLVDNPSGLASGNADEHALVEPVEIAARGFDLGGGAEGVLAGVDVLAPPETSEDFGSSMAHTPGLDIKQMAAIGAQGVPDVSDYRPVHLDDLPVGAHAWDQAPVKVGPGECSFNQGDNAPSAGRDVP
jgi:hypothetical protein